MKMRYSRKKRTKNEEPKKGKIEGEVDKGGKKTGGGKRRGII